MFYHVIYCSGIRLCQEYEAIADKGLSTPTDTSHMMELKEFMTKAVKTTLPQMEQAVYRAKDCLLFLVCLTNACFGPGAHARSTEYRPLLISHYCH